MVTRHQDFSWLIKLLEWNYLGCMYSSQNITSRLIWVLNSLGEIHYYSLKFEIKSYHTQVLACHPGRELPFENQHHPTLSHIYTFNLKSDYNPELISVSTQNVATINSSCCGLITSKSRTVVQRPTFTSTVQLNYV